MATMQAIKRATTTTTPTMATITPTTAIPTTIENIWEGDFSGCDLGLLEGYTVILGNVTIHDCNVLTNVNDVSSLTTVGGFLRIVGNAALTNVNGFSSLTTVRTHLVIQNNSALTDVNGFSGLTTVGDYIRFCGNDKLTTIPSLFTTLSAGKTDPSQCLKTGNRCC